MYLVFLHTVGTTLDFFHDSSPSHSIASHEFVCSCARTVPHPAAHQRNQHRVHSQPVLLLTPPMSSPRVSFCTVDTVSDIFFWWAQQPHPMATASVMIIVHFHVLLLHLIHPIRHVMGTRQSSPPTSSIPVAASSLACTIFFPFGML